MGILRYTFAFVVMLVVFQLCIVPAGAQSAKQQLDRLDREQRQNRQRVKEIKQKKGAIEDQLKSLDAKMNDKELEVRKIEDQLELAQKHLKKAQAEKKTIEDNLLGYRDALGSRMRSIYMLGDMTYLDLLFSAGNFSDFVDRVFYVQTICGRDEELIGKTQEDQKLLAEKIAQIDVKLSEIERYRAAQRIQLGELTAMKRAKNSDLATVDNNLELALQAEREMEVQRKLISQAVRSSSQSAGRYRGAPWTGSFRKPCPGPIMSGFGTRVHPILKYRRKHTGIDIGASRGTSVKAAGNGKVTRTGWYGGYGNCVIIDHGGKPNRSTLYGHLSAITCVSGQEIKAGVEIGKVGSTGMSTGPHLHFEVLINGTPVDPQIN